MSSRLVDSVCEFRQRQRIIFIDRMSLNCVVPLLLIATIAFIISHTTSEPNSQLTFPCIACSEAVSHWQRFGSIDMTNMSRNDLTTICRRLLRRTAQIRQWREESVPQARPQTCLEYANGECLARVTSDSAINSDQEPDGDCDDEVNPFCVYFRQSNMSIGIEDSIGADGTSDSLPDGPAANPNRHALQWCVSILRLVAADRHLEQLLKHGCIARHQDGTTYETKKCPPRVACGCLVSDITQSSFCSIDMSSDRCVTIKGIFERDDVGRSIEKGVLDFEAKVAHVDASVQSHDIQRRIFGKVYN